MKKAIIIGAFLLPLVSFGATQVIQNLKSYEFVGNIQTENRGNVLIYKYQEASTTCYVASQSFGQSGANLSISCLK